MSGYVLLITDWGKLRPVEIQEEKEKKLAIIENGSTNEIAGEFIDALTCLFSWLSSIHGSIESINKTSHLNSTNAQMQLNWEMPRD
ncbi:hypothetical protein MMC17_000088 [Xylographa soralifera]|nr:hypothetical protein [Xylographa soralifera]